MLVQTACEEDVQRWLELAAEVEELFGPMVGAPGFHRALGKNLDRRSAYCVREGDGPPGSPLAGAIMFSPSPPEYKIGWLAVAGRWRRRGVGRLLVEHVLAQVVPPASVRVITFSEGEPEGLPARFFYESMGFRPAGVQPTSGPRGGPAQIYLRCFPEDLHED